MPEVAPRLGLHHFAHLRAVAEGRAIVEAARCRIPDDRHQAAVDEELSLVRRQ